MPGCNCALCTNLEKTQCSKWLSSEKKKLELNTRCWRRRGFVTISIHCRGLVRYELFSVWAHLSLFKLKREKKYTNQNPSIKTEQTAYGDNFFIISRRVKHLPAHWGLQLAGSGFCSELCWMGLYRVVCFCARSPAASWIWHRRL